MSGQAKGSLVIRYAFDMCHCLVLGPSCTIGLTTYECGSISSTHTEDKIFFQAGEMALTSQAFQTIAAEGPGSQVRKVEAQEEQE